MSIVELIRNNIKSLKNHLSGKKAGIYPADFGRFNKNMKDYMAGFNITGIYLPDEKYCDQGFTVFRDIENFIQNIDVCLVFGKDEYCSKLHKHLCSARIEIINVFNAYDKHSFVYSEKEYRYMDLYEMNKEDLTLLSDLSIKIDNLKSALFHGYEPEFYEKEKSFMKSAGYGEYPVKLPEKNINSFIWSILQCGKAFAPCPVCGKVCSTDQSFLVHYPDLNYDIFYRFECHYEFFILKGTHVIGMYITEHNLLIRSMLPSMYFVNMVYYPEILQFIIERFKKFMVYSLDNADLYINNGIQKKTQCIIGGWEKSFGTYLRNELTEIQQIVDSGGHKALQSILITQSDELDFEALFPEMPKAIRLDKGEEQRMAIDAFNICLKGNWFSLSFYYGGEFQETLGKRIFNLASKRCNRDVKKIEKKIKKNWPRLWISLRHRRQWVSQIEGISFLLNKLCESYPLLAVIMDGTPEDEVTYSEIKNKLSREITIFNALYFSKWDTFYLSSFIDLHITPAGQGTIFMTAANKPGIFHTNSLFKKEFYVDKDGFVNCTLRENSAKNIFIPPLRDIQKPGTDPYECDYELDSGILLETVSDMLRKYVKKIWAL